MNAQLLQMSPRRSAIEESRLLLTLQIAGRLCGIPVPCVRDVLRAEAITRVPLAPPGVAGVLNLRGRIVTAVELRSRLGLPPADRGAPQMSIIVEYDGELYSLVADSVREVISISPETREEAPATLGDTWRTHATAVYQLDGELLIELDPAQLLAFGRGVEGGIS
ncbi:chemotaxis protein CheW [Roseomonas sp. SSH11]|uniref:Chemotaxis protein CheW n=1 Tax=Pararoseomonas baculiformis TaxID=2820812 RepID=A0ABS4AKT5_9PROT|nr:chemotaxis protein CheW [Pararoseomonas baculiformis]